VSEPERNQTLSGLTLQDFSALPRFGLKGIKTRDWLDAHNYRVGDASNRAYPQDDGCLATRLSRRELLLLSDPDRPLNFADHDYFSPGRDCYPIRRQDSHYWISVCGENSPSMLAKLCGVDFSTDQFEVHRVAQTQVARTSAIVVRNDLSDRLRYYLLGDSSTKAYMWACLQDAMSEYDTGVFK
jgi:sarcosine oxidase subunit gamma